MTVRDQLCGLGQVSHMFWLCFLYEKMGSLQWSGEAIITEVTQNRMWETLFFNEVFYLHGILQSLVSIKGFEHTDL